MKFLIKINNFFELNFGWIFINGNKREKYLEDLKEKYKNDIPK